MQPTIHTRLAQSYLAYFVASIVGLFVDTMISFDIGRFAYAGIVAVVCFALGGVLIAWAQYTSRHTKHSPSDPYFHKGPYRYMRNPTHLGIVFLVTGYTAVSGSIVFFGVTVIGYVVSNIFFQKYEALLDLTYDGVYEDYKRDVPKIF